MGSPVASPEPCRKAKTFALDLVWSPRPAFPGHQAGGTCTLEVGLGLDRRLVGSRHIRRTLWVTDILSTDTP